MKLSPLRIVEFIVAGLVLDLTENIISIKLTTDADITWNLVLVALAVVIPFAIITEIVIDHPEFWKRMGRFIKKLL